MSFKEMGAEIRHENTYPDILTSGAVAFLAEMTRAFRGRLEELLDDRDATHSMYRQGLIPSFPSETADTRNAAWKVATCPDELLNRRVEITGPPERKMVINALNSGANVFMADFEDSLSPIWENLLEGQRNLRDATRRSITYQHPSKGLYELCVNPAVLFVRPRGLHLSEAHMLVDGERVPAALFDFGLFMYHNAEFLVDSGSGPYFYLPKLEHYLEARWWNDVFNWAQHRLDIPMGVIRATVLIETLPAALQMDEILYELRDHSAGLNCGRWDYIFSYIKTFQNDPERVLPDRAQVGMTNHFMKSYSERLIQVCHRRGAHAMGGMAAQIPIRHDIKAHTAAMARVRADKEREVSAGHDGTWVAHPALVGLALEVFDESLWESGDNQIDRKTNYACTLEDLTRPPQGTITHAGLKQNIDVGIRYLAAWLEGSGCVPLYDLMEDAATAEISRVQVWQWLKHKACTEDGTLIDESLLSLEIEKVTQAEPTLESAATLFTQLCTQQELPEFLTLLAYERITNEQ